MNRFLSLILFFTSVVAIAATPPCDSLLDELDTTIANSSEYEKEKRLHIDIIKNELNKSSLSDDERYGIYRRLYNEYESYICDSARYYINLCLTLGRQANKQNWINYSQIKKARILSRSGLFTESIDQIRAIDRTSLSKEQLTEYYKTIENTYLYLSEYSHDDEYTPQYLNKVKVYRDSSMALLQPSTFNQLITTTQGFIQQGQLSKAKILLQNYADSIPDNSREYAVVCSTLSYAFELEGNTDERMAWLIRSAIADIKSVTKENTALRQIAEMLYESGDLARANRYVKKSLADATFFNGRMRNMQSTRMLPMIDEAHQEFQDIQHRKVKTYLFVISILSVFLVVAIYLIFRQMKRVSRAHDKMKEINSELNKLNEELLMVNRQQQETCTSLRESNCIKEEYIGRFIELCSTYISEMDSYRKMLNHKAMTGKIDEVTRTLKSKQFIDDSYTEFYRNFDESFLSIFPTFVESVNSMFTEDKRIIPKPTEKLNTELRMYALIRLGINDCTKIANFLRCSVSTIYTYRSRIKNQSLYRDDFEERIMAISSLA